MAVVNLVSGVHPALAGRLEALHAWLPLEVTSGSRLATILAGFALLLLSRALARRKRVAWGLTLVAVVVSIAGHLGKGLDWEEALFGLVLVGLLVGYRHQFHALSDGLSMRRALWTLAAAAMFVLMYGTVGFFVLDHHFQENFDAVASVRQTLQMFVAFDDPGLVPRTAFGAWFAGSIYVMAGLTGGLALLLLLRPVVVRAPATPVARARARNLVERYGRSSVARFTLFDDKSYVFTDGGSVVAYVARGGTALALGDPIGPPEDARAAIDDFQAEARRHDWAPAFYQATPEDAAHYRDAGFDLLSVGREAIVETATFTLDGKAGATFRTARNRLERAGHRVTVTEGSLDAATWHELQEVSDEWLTMQRTREMRFSLGRFDFDYLAGSIVVIARDATGRITAFANANRAAAASCVALDLMRRRRDVEPGTMDALIVSLIEWARGEKLAEVSLGLSPLAGVGGERDDSVAARGLGFLYRRLDRYHHFRGLHDFKAKFHPRWDDRFLAHVGNASLPGVAAAILSATLADRPW